MFKNTLTAQQIIEQADLGAYVEIQEGVYLASSATMEEEQAKWDDEDEAKNFDFSGAPYWITNDAGGAPLAISGASDAALLSIVNDGLYVAELSFTVHY